MPSLTYSAAMTANQTGLNPISGWQFEYAPYNCAVQILVNATTAGVRMTLYTGSQTIQQRSPVAGGGTAGTLPTIYNTPPITFVASAGDRIILSLDEVLGGTPTVNLQIIVEPLG